MGDREERRQAAREAVLQARREAAQPWWQKWVFSVPARLWRSAKWLAREVGKEVQDLLLTVAALALVTAVFLLASRAAPVPAVVLIVGFLPFLLYGVAESFWMRRRGRLALTVVAAFGFVALFGLLF